MAIPPRKACWCRLCLASAPLPLTAIGTGGLSSTQNLLLQVKPSFSSPNTRAFAAGQADAFTIATVGTGASATTLSVTAGTLPGDITFQDNGNGTATLRTI